MCHSAPQKFSMYFLRWQNNLHEALASWRSSQFIKIMYIRSGWTLFKKVDQSIISERSMFLSKQLWWVQLPFFSHTQRKINIQLEGIVSQMQHLTGRLLLPLANYEQQQQKSCINQEKKTPTIKLGISEGMNLSRVSRQSSLTAVDQARTSVSSFENWILHLEWTSSP